MNRTGDFRSSDQLFICFEQPALRWGLSKQCLSHWIVQATKASCETKGVSLPQVHTHSTRSIATSWALFHGLDVKQIQFSYIHALLSFGCQHWHLHSVLCDQVLVASRLGVCRQDFTEREADFYLENFTFQDLFSQSDQRRTSGFLETSVL